jgi:hypothetical protein
MSIARFRPWLLALVLVAACKSAPTLEAFTSDPGGFAISTPVTLEASQQSVNTEAGSIEIQTYVAEDREAVYVVAYSDYPPDLVAQNDPATLLDGSRDGAVSNVGGTLISEDTIDLKGNPGRSLIIDTQTETREEATVYARLYLVENRLYQVVVVVPQTATEQVEASTFLDSFTLIE